MKRPAFQFYPADWRKDAALQSCSIAAQGLWINAMCIAHECEPYGHLVVNGKPMDAAKLGRLVGLSEKDCAKLIDELSDAGVVERTAEGVIYSRRMVRDEELRNKRANGGSAGAEHGIKGAEHGSKGGRPKRPTGVNKPPLEPPPSSSSSTSMNTDTDVSVVGGEPPDPANQPGSTVRTMPLPCPKERIAERFSEALPMLPRVKLWPKARESALRSRWGEMLREKRWQTTDEGVVWFDAFFRHAAKSDFITGRRKGSGAHAGWSADFDFLIGPKGFTGVREGKYDNQEATA